MDILIYLWPHTEECTEGARTRFWGFEWFYRRFTPSPGIIKNEKHEINKKKYFVPKASFMWASQSQQIVCNVIVSNQQPVTICLNDNISCRIKIKTNPVQLNFEFPKTPKNTVQMNDLLAKLFCDKQISRKVWTDSNIVTGRFGSATVNPPRDFLVQMNDLDAGNSSRCDLDARVNEPLPRHFCFGWFCLRKTWFPTDSRTGWYWFSTK